MSSTEISVAISSNELPAEISADMISQLVGQVFETAPPSEKSRLLECLLMPLGVLSLVAIANGIFANIRFRSGWPDIHVRPEDAQNVKASDVITLVTHVQQVSLHAINGLAHTLAASPMMTGSAAAAMLMTLLMQRAQHRRASDNDSTDRHPTAVIA